jgi:lysozyme
VQLSFTGKKLIQDREGFRDKAYQDGAGVWTVGYGTTKIDGKPVLPGQTCSKEQADIWMDADSVVKQTAVNKLVKAKLTQNMFDALVSLVYNIGEGNFSTSTLLKRLDTADYKGAAEAFLMWNKMRNPKTGLLEVSPGLAARRMVEKSQFET